MEKKSKKSVLIGITSLFLVTIILLGLTYAYYRTRIIGNESTDPSISVTSKTMEVTYVDGNAYFTPVSTGVQGEYNVDDSEILIEPGDSFRKEFSVKNTGDERAYFSIVFDEMTNEYMRNHDWSYSLTREIVEVDSTNAETTIEASKEVASGTLAVGSHQIIVPSEGINVSTTEGTEIVHKYVLELEYVNEESIDQSEDMGSELTFRVNISEETYTWEYAPSGSLLYALKANQPSGSEETVPGQAQSTENEARILTTEDDYGTSYVYRGAVTNNYVTYSNMCWRIVRVQGDGTIKLVLADGTHPCGTDTGYSAEYDDSAFITDENGKLIEKRYSEYQDAISALFENSNIPSILSTWSTNFNLDTSKLVETEWCNDASVVEDLSYGEKEIELENGELDYEITYDKNLEGYTWVERYDFGSYKRLQSNKTAEPTLKCNQRSVELYDKSLQETLKATRYKNVLGILSADEVMFAGEKSGSSWDEQNYLRVNAGGRGSWTMTPSYFDFEASGLNVWYYYHYEWEDDYIEHDFVSEYANDTNAVRPSVVLRSDVLLDTTVTGQNGTIDAPYVIG